MTNEIIDNWMNFPYPPSLLKSYLGVKSYAHFIKGLSNRPNLRTQMMDHQSNDGPSAQVVIWSYNN